MEEEEEEEEESTMVMGKGRLLVCWRGVNAMRNREGSRRGRKVFLKRSIVENDSLLGGLFLRRTNERVVLEARELW